MKMLVTKLSQGKYANEGQLFAEPISDDNVKLMGKCFCGYCGRQLRSAAGTTTDGTILRYYRCPYSKKDVNCHNKSVRKEVLEEIVTNVLAEELTKPDNLKFLISKVFELYCENQDNSDLHHYEKELTATDKAITNILKAIEEGIRDLYLSASAPLK